MKAKLLSRWGPEKGAEYWIEAEVTIGRGAGNDIRLDAKAVSGQHARIFFDADSRAYFLEDLGSLNGTELDGIAVTRTERLGKLHVVGLAGVCELLFVAVDRTPEPPKRAESAPEAAAEPPPAPREGTRVDAEMPELPAALRAGGEPIRGVTQIEQAVVELPGKLSSGEVPEPEPRVEPEPEFVLAVMEEGTPRRFVLEPGENLVGRSRGARVALRSPQLSRKHAVLTVAGGRVTVRDLGSRNQTYVEDRPIDRETELEPRSRLRFGLLEAHLLRRDDDDLTVPPEAE